MSKALPKELLQYVDHSSTLNSIRNMVVAVEGGDIDISSLVAFAKVSGSEEKPKFSKTTPIPIDMLEAIRGNRDMPARQIVYAGVADGRWTFEDATAFEENMEVISDRAKKSPPSKSVYLTRTRKTRPHRANVEGMFVPKTSLDVFCRSGLSDGARACMSLLLALTGKQESLTTYTSSLASMMGRTTRTIRNYFITLEGAGLITRKPGEHYNTVLIKIHSDCRPAPYEEPTDVTAYKLARNSSDPLLNEMAMTVAITSFDAHQEYFARDDRRKVISPFNLESKYYVRKEVEIPSLSRSTIMVDRKNKSSLRPPTSHSNLLLSPEQPINGNRRKYQRYTSYDAYVAR